MRRHIHQTRLIILFFYSSQGIPEKVSGVATIIADRPHIVLNRAKSQDELQYTLPHELGHHKLHLNPVREYAPLGFPVWGDAEFEADLFAMSWLFFLSKDSSGTPCCSRIRKYRGL